MNPQDWLNDGFQVEDLGHGSAYVKRYDNGAYLVVTAVDTDDVPGEFDPVQCCLYTPQNEESGPDFVITLQMNHLQGDPECKIKIRSLISNVLVCAGMAVEQVIVP
jgi:hypothetical protein